MFLFYIPNAPSILKALGRSAKTRSEIFPSLLVPVRSSGKKVICFSWCGVLFFTKFETISSFNNSQLINENLKVNGALLVLLNLIA